jgi:DNA-binding CsgD family transcriptional regulator
VTLPVARPRRPAVPRAAVTRRQLEILALAGSGYTSSQIGARLGIEACTVRERLHRVYRKLGARSGTHAVAIALATGLLHADDIEMPAAQAALARLQKPADGRESAPQPASGVWDARDAANGSQGRSGAAA